MTVVIRTNEEIIVSVADMSVPRRRERIDVRGFLYKVKRVRYHVYENGDMVSAAVYVKKVSYR